MSAGAALTSRRHRRPPGLLWIGCGLLGAVSAMALLAPVLAQHDPAGVSGSALTRPSASHWLGTDIPGRDLFAQLVYGARTSLVVAVAGAAVAVLGAIVVGVLPALAGGAADALSMRAVVFLLAVPGLPLLVLVGAMVGDSRAAVIVLIGTIGVAPNARVLRSQTLSLRQRGFVAVSRGLGGGSGYVLRRHIVPALGPLLVIGYVNWAGVAIGLEAGLSFLGVGDPTGVSWGLTLNRALTQPGIYFSAMWTWWVLPAGLAITATVLGCTFVGVALEPRFNPRWLRAT